ncbi:MAG TPA: serine hydrolase domain-containing protein [Jatrophihabitans sp.]|nr:serine hydrolase domain-containing protein [Jatrophihabitans sp.]
MTGLLAGWPVAHAALAVVTPDGVRYREGDTAHRFWLASVTKPLAGLAALVAVQEGAVELDAPVVGSCLPASLDAELPGVTLRHLLSHASGLAPDKLARAAAPGTRRIYSNAGFDLIGALVTAATEIPFAEYLAEAVFAPLGMRGAALDGSPARDGWASVDDLVPVLAELLSPGRVLDPATLAEAVSVQFPSLPGVLPGYGSQADNAWGLSFEIRAAKQPHWTSLENSPGTYGHFGQGGTMFWVDPAARLGVVALADEPFGQWAIDAWPVLSTEVLQQFG